MGWLSLSGVSFFCRFVGNLFRYASYFVRVHIIGLYSHEVGVATSARLLHGGLGVRFVGKAHARVGLVFVFYRCGEDLCSTGVRRFVHHLYYGRYEAIGVT